VKVKVKWGSKWYPATVLRHIEEDKVEIEFDDSEYPSAIVSTRYTKAVKSVIAESPTIKPVAGAFNWERFKEFCKFIIGDKSFVKALSVQELAELDLKSSLFSTHANERIEERYSEHMQELHRSLSSNQYLAFQETRRKVFCGALSIDCTPDLKHIISHRSTEGSTRGHGRPNLEPEDIGSLSCALEEWNRRHVASDHLDIDFETCKVINFNTIQVITTTTRFVLNQNYSRIVTVIKIKCFSKWQKHNQHKSSKGQRALEKDKRKRKKSRNWDKDKSRLKPTKYW
jgi:hypothetical protein